MEETMNTTVTPQVVTPVQVQAPPPPPPIMQQPVSVASYASFVDRFVASLLDFLILTAVGAAIGLALGALGMKFLLNPLSFLLGWGYPIYFIGTTGATIGKRVMKIKVVKTNGSQPNFVDAFLREVVGKFVSAIILLIGYFWMLWDPNKQCLHDKIANTYVVKV